MRFANIIAAAVFSCAGPAGAAQIIQEFSSTNIVPDSVSLFDTQLGQLTSVRLSLTAGAGQVFGINDQPGTYTAVLTGLIKLTGSSGGDLGPQIYAEGSHTFYYDFTNPVQGVLSAGEGSFTLTGAAMNGFIGTGELFLNPSPAGGGSFEVTGPNGPASYYPIDGYVYAGGQIIYDYIAVGEVPEPASWLMMITGFGLVGGSLRSGYSKTKATQLPPGLA
jgi:hypothetical protein